MISNYSCKKCYNFSSNNLNDLKKHLLKKKTCPKTNKSFIFSEDQLLAISILPNNTSSSISIKDTEHLKDSNIMNKNKFELFELFKSIEKKKETICCNFCKNEFKLVIELKKHLILNCFFEELKKRENEEKILNTEINSNNKYDVINNTNNNTNSNNTVNNNNNSNNNTYNITIEIKNPVGFDNQWDLSKINEANKRDISFSNCMYTNLLEEILKNEINLNVIIDNDNDSGMVYKNDIDKYIQMKSKDIVDNTMKKLNEHLMEINKANKKSLEDIVKIGKNKIIKKYEDYEQNDNIQKYVESAICGVFENKKSDALSLAIKNKKYEMINNEYDNDNCALESYINSDGGF
jgi:hypothetical protein